jgi:hypothetical protein
MCTFASIEPGWLTQALQARDGAVASVRSITPEAVPFAGSTTAMARLRIAYADDGTPGPATVIGKLRGGTEIQRQMDAAMSLFEREGRFYKCLAGALGIRTPACYAVGDGDATPLLLEDLAALRMGDQMDGLALADAEVTIDALADLHAGLWNSPSLDGQPWLAAPASGTFAAMICQLVASGAPALAERYRDTVPAATLDAVLGAAPDWQRVLDRCAEGPQTLVHNDCRLDNLFFDGGDVVFIDWQIAARSRGTQDVGNLLAGSMDSATLAANWQALVHRYHDRLQANGITGYSLDECLHHYRQSVVFPLGGGIALLGAMDTGDGRGLGDVIVRRCLTHIADVDAFAAITER